MARDRYKSAKTADVLADHQEVLVVTRRTRTAIKVIAAGLVLAFGWLSLRGFDLTPLAKSVSSEMILRLALTLYLSCWTAGLFWDLSDQESVILKAPRTRHVVVGETAFGAAFVLLFGALCYVGSDKLFAGFLTLFLFANIGMWLYYVRVALKEPIRISKRRYREHDNYIGLEQLHYAYEVYLCGGWQWARFGMGLVIVLIINLFAYTAAGAAVQTATGASMDLIISVSFLSFVIAMELWIWSERLTGRARVRLLHSMRTRYDLKPHSRQREPEAVVTN